VKTWRAIISIAKLLTPFVSNFFFRMKKPTAASTDTAKFSQKSTADTAVEMMCGYRDTGFRI
jgi:hypothetical protein